MTTIPTYYPKVDSVWSIYPRGSIITTMVQFGGRNSILYAFRWSRGALLPLANWAGEDFSIDRVRGELAITVYPIDYTQVPELYMWDGNEFAKGGHDAQAFYADLANRYLNSMSNPGLPPEAIVEYCKLALQAEKLAGAIDVARKACQQARDRIQSAEVSPQYVGRKTPEQIQEDKKRGVSKIDQILKESYGS